MRARLLCLLLAGCANSALDKKEDAPENALAPVETGKLPAPVEGTLSPTLPTPTQPGIVLGNKAAPAAKAPRTKVRLAIRCKPQAWVFWGKKKLGQTPLNLDLPRDSGPVDLVLRADGHIPLHTRAYTFRTDIIGVKLTPLEERQNVFGAKKELKPAEEPAPEPEAAAAEAAPSVPSPSAPPAPAPMLPPEGE